MKTTVITIAVLIFCLSLSNAQTTYTESPMAYVCGNYDSGGSGIRFRINPTPIAGNNAIFRIRKAAGNTCSGSDPFGTSGTMQIREGSINGTIVSSCNMSSCGGGTTIDLSETLTFTSGSKNYYATIFASGFNYWAGPITITASTPSCPDLIVENMAVTSPAPQGTTVNISCRVKNSGAGTAGSSTLRYYLSSNITLGNDVELDSDFVSSLSSGSFSNESSSFNLSASATPGTYYVLFVADADGQVNECVPGGESNVFWKSFTIVESCKDLEVISYSVSPVHAHPGETITLNCNVTNSGNASAEASTLYYYLDINPGTGVPSTNIGSDPVSSLSPGQSSAESFSQTFLPTAPTGQYYMKWKADATNTVSECNENNNVEFTTFWIDPTEGSNLRLNAAISINPNPAIQGQPATFSAVIINNAPGEWKGDLQMQLLDAGGVVLDVIDNAPNLTIGPGSSNTYTFSHSTASISNGPGNYQVAILYKDINSATWANVNGGPYSNPQNFSISLGTPSVSISAPVGGYAYPKYNVDGSFNSININWTSSNVPNGVGIELRDQNGNYVLQIDGNAPNTGSFNWQLTNAVNSGSYKILIYPYGTTGYPFYSGVFKIIDLPNLSVPSNNFVYTSLPNSINYQWIKNNPTNLANYEIKLRDLTTDVIILNYVTTQSESAHLHSYAYQDGHDYRWVVRAKAGTNNATAESAPFDFSVLVDNTCAVPDHTSFTANSITQNSFIADWPNVPDASSYEINVRLEPGDYTNDLVFNSSTNSSQILVSALTPATSYKYRVRAVCSVESSLWSSSSTQTFTTLPPGGCPTPDPTTFLGNSYTANSFIADWADVSGAVSYHIKVKYAWDTDYNNPVFSGTSSSSSKLVSGLSPNNEYQYQIQAICSSGSGNWSPSSIEIFKTVGSNTNYTSVPAAGPDAYTSCPTTDYDLCAGYAVLGGGVIKVALVDVLSTKFKFKIKKCTGTFINSGTAYIKVDDQCGTVVGGPVNYAVGTSEVIVYVDIPPGNTGTLNYYGIVATNTPNQDRYWAGPVAITGNNAIAILSPNGGESFEAGQVMPPISWSSTGNIGNVSIEMESYGQVPMDTFVIADGIPNSSPFTGYTIPVCAEGNYRIKIYETGNGAATAAWSAAPFSISINSAIHHITLLAPNGGVGQNYNAGDPYPEISWNSSGNIGNISIELVDEQGVLRSVVANDIPDISPYVPGAGEVFYTNLPQGAYRFRIYNTACGSVSDLSDATFFINSTYTGTCTCTIDNPSPAQTESYAAALYLCEHCILDDPLPPANDIFPQDLIIKEDLAKITFLALFGDPTTNTYADDFPTPFFDMQQSSPYQRYGKVLSYLEYGDGISPFNRRLANYNPGSPVTRGQVCKVYCEAFNITCDATTSSFTIPPDHPEFKYVAELEERGLLNTTNSDFKENDNAKREEAFILLHRILAQCSNCLDDALLASEADTAQTVFFDPGNYTPDNLGRHPGFSDANFDTYNATGFYLSDRGMPLVFGHSYNSYLTELPDQFFPQRPLGNGWLHTYNAYIVRIPYTDNIGLGENTLAAVWPDGSIHLYKEDGTSSPEKITKGNYDVIDWNAGTEVFTIKKKNQVLFKFEKITGATDAPYMLTEIKDRNNNRMVLVYQVHNYGGKNLARLKEVTGTTGRKLVFTYHGTSDKIKTVSETGLNRSIEFYFGASNNLDTRLLWYKDAEAKETTYNYDNQSVDGYYLLKKITLPNGNFITNNYYEKKLTASITNDGTTNNTVQTNVDWSLANGASGANSQVTVSDGVSVRSYIYITNSLGKITEIETPTNDAIILYEDALNPTLPTSITVAGQTTTYEYDMMANVTDVHQEMQVDHYFEYNTNNDLTLYRNPRMKETAFVYADGKNLSAIHAPIGSTQMTYYPYGLLKTVTNPEGIVSSYEYDTYGNVKKMTAPGGIQSTAVFDAGSRLTQFFNPNNQKTTYNYNDRNFLTQVNNHLPNHPQYQQVSIQYNYDDNGNLTEITNPLNKVTHLNYDYFDLLESESFGSATRHYDYDEEGKLRKITKADGVQLIYNYYQDQGLLQSDGYATYTYDVLKRLKTVAKDNKTITFNYDNLNRITSTVYNNKTVQYEYDKNSNVLKIIYPGGNAVSYTYDDNDRMKTVKWNNTLQAEYFYLLDGRMDHSELANGVSTYYYYDAAGRVDSLVTRKNTDIICAYGFELDKLGNHKVENKTEPFAYSAWPTIDETDYSYNLSRNEILTGGNKSFTHDNNGNMKSVAGAKNLTYSWDAHDMLIGVSGDFNATYTYDGLGHRRSATRNTVSTNYVLDILGMSRILIEEDENGNAQNYYVYGLGMVSRVKPNGDTRYYHYDFRGSTVAMTDENGILTHQYAYDEYGGTLQSQEEDFNPFRFVGGFGVMQEDSTLLFMRARYYDVEIGRFLSEDPIWNANLYAYGGNNPVSNIDENGEFWHVIGGAVVGGIANGVAYIATTDNFSWRELGYEAGKGAVVTAVTLAAGPGMGAIVNGAFTAGEIYEETGDAKKATIGGVISGGISYGTSIGIDKLANSSVMKNVTNNVTKSLSKAAFKLSPAPASWKVAKTGAIKLSSAIGKEMNETTQYALEEYMGFLGDVSANIIMDHLVKPNLPNSTLMCVESSPSIQYSPLMYGGTVLY